MWSCHQIDGSNHSGHLDLVPKWAILGWLWVDGMIYSNIMSHIIWFIRIGKRFRLIECDVFSCSSYGNDIVFCQVNQFYIQGHDMLIKPPAKPIDFRSLLIIYYSNDIYRSNQSVGTSIFSALILIITMWPLWEP